MQDSALGDNYTSEENASDELTALPQVKRKPNKNKNRNVSFDQFMSHTTPTEFFGSIQTGDTSVYIDKDISYHVEPEDSCFLAFVYPSSKSADPPATPSPEGTVNSVSLPEEYSDLMAAFSDGTHELPDHGPHDIEITLESNKVPALGPLYNLSDSEQKIVEKYVKDMLDKGLIRPSKSPCGAPILFTQKKDGLL